MELQLTIYRYPASNTAEQRRTGLYKNVIARGWPKFVRSSLLLARCCHVQAVFATLFLRLKNHTATVYVIVSHHL